MLPLERERERKSQTTKREAALTLAMRTEFARSQKREKLARVKNDSGDAEGITMKENRRLCAARELDRGMEKKKVTCPVQKSRSGCLERENQFADRRESLDT